jgi:hypothetical protein
MDDVQRNALVAVGVTFMGAAIAWGSTVSLVARHSVLVRFAFPAGMFLIGSTLVILAMKGKRVPQPTPTPLDGAIRDGRALLKHMSPRESITSKALADEMRAWERKTDQMLRRQYGVGSIFGFYDARSRDSHPAMWILKQIEFLEVLREQRTVAAVRDESRPPELL